MLLSIVINPNPRSSVIIFLFYNFTSCYTNQRGLKLKQTLNCSDGGKWTLNIWIRHNASPLLQLLLSWRDKSCVTFLRRMTETFLASSKNNKFYATFLMPQTNKVLLYCEAEFHFDIVLITTRSSLLFCSLFLTMSLLYNLAVRVMVLIR